MYNCVYLCINRNEIEVVASFFLKIILRLIFMNTDSRSTNARNCYFHLTVTGRCFQYKRRNMLWKDVYKTIDCNDASNYFSSYRVHTVFSWYHVMNILFQEISIWIKRREREISSTNRLSHSRKIIVMLNLFN